MNNTPTLEQRLQALRDNYAEIVSRQLSLDLTRGKPSSAQLALSDGLDGILNGNYRAQDGTDCRNYGGGLGIPEARALAAEYLGCNPDQTLVGGNSSLQLMYQYVLFAMYFGVTGEASWASEAGEAGAAVKFLCPVPGYDRHFSVCESLGIGMLPVEMSEDGPDMDAVEALVAADPLIKGIWCVPKYSNPSGIVYSDAVVDRLARLAKTAGKNFRVMWDNAYAIHDLVDNPPRLANILELARGHGTLDSVIAIGSTSKITFAGAGIAFIGTSTENLRRFSGFLGLSTIGPDKINQLRHVRFLKDSGTIKAHMARHREILQAKFESVLRKLEQGLGGKEVDGRPIATWTRPKGGYFILLNTQAGLAARVIQLASEAGVKLTPAGSTWPYRKDPHDRDIRLAPSFPQPSEIEAAMDVVVNCVELATLEKALRDLA